jgi:methionine-gamma-lyase
MANPPAHYGLSSQAIHAGRVHESHGAHVTPIYQSSTFAVEEAEDFIAIATGQRPGYLYTRLGNPNVTQVEAKLAALEGWGLRQRGQEAAAKVFPSGMAAISSAVLARVRSGDHIVAQDQLYSATHALFYSVLTNYGITCSAFDPHQGGALEAELEAHPNTRLVYIETPANPTLKIVDIAEVVAAAQARGAWVMADNTFATPFCQRPLEMGVDVVAHSATKYLGGHGQIISGAIVSPHEDYIQRDVMNVIKNFGPCASPFEAWLLDMGLRTFPLRMERHCASALQVARYLAAHPKVEQVLYPGLEAHPLHAVARRQMPGGFGGMLSFEVRGGEAAGKALLQRTRLITFAVSLGHVASLIQHPASMSHYHVPAEARERQGITPGLLRLSIGIEDPADILDDLEQALRGI